MAISVCIDITEVVVVIDPADIPAEIIEECDGDIDAAACVIARERAHESLVKGFQTMGRDAAINVVEVINDDATNG